MATVLARDNFNGTTGIALSTHTPAWTVSGTGAG